MQKNIPAIKNAIENIFEQLHFCLGELSLNKYTQPIETLMNASIGNHIRHIIELFIELNKGYETGVINYDNRRRDLRIETNIDFALLQLEIILSGVDKTDKNLLLISNFSEDELIETKTNYARELVYNVEHAVHHIALIRVGLKEISNIELPKEFGVAASTIKHQKLCVQ